MFTSAYEDYEKLEQEEFELTQAHIVMMLYMVGDTHYNIERELRAIYQRYGKDGVVTYGEMLKWINSKDKRRRYTALTLFLVDQFTNMRDKLETQFYNMLREIVTKESIFFGTTVDVQKILGKSWGIDDLTWLERVQNDIVTWNAHIQQDMKRALLQHKNIEEIIEQLNKRFNTIQNAVTNLGITESTATTSLTRQQIFKDINATHYRFYTKEDERTCEICGTMHDQIFPISAYEVGVTASPMHPFVDALKFQLWIQRISKPIKI